MKKNLFKNISILIFGVVLTGLLFFINTYTKNKHYNIQSTYVIDFSDTKKASGFADNIFIGEVIENLGLATKQQGTGNIPNTLFKVVPLYNIKGNLKGDVIIKQEGGYDEKGNLYTIEGQKMLEKGDIYLLSTKGDSFTIISHPNGSHLITSLNDVNKKDLKNIIKSNSKVVEFRKGYKEELYYEENDVGEKYKISSEKNAYKNLSKKQKEDFENLESGFTD